MGIVKISPDVYVAQGGVLAISNSDVEFLKAEVLSSPKGRVRINLHQASSDLLHEMIIAIDKNSYIRPHLHINKSESFHIIYGSVDVVLFNSFGDIEQVISLDALDPTKAFCYRMSEPIFHSLVVRSEILVMHEITNGPFRSGDALLADFAPSEDDHRGVIEWTNYLKNSIGI